MATNSKTSAPTASSAPAATPFRQIRAAYDDSTITVYQAYSWSIAREAVAGQKLTAAKDFKVGRMTWVKPSWCWMMYRCGYSYKDKNQAGVLALKIDREEFLGMLRKGVLSHKSAQVSAETEGQKTGMEVGEGVSKMPDAEASGEGERKDTRVKKGGRVRTGEVRIQWDPERDARLEKLGYRSIQIGIPAEMSKVWAEEWVVGIEDVTERATELKRVLDEEPEISDEELVRRGLVPVEREFPLPEDIKEILCMNPIEG